MDKMLILKLCKKPPFEVIKLIGIFPFQIIKSIDISITVTGIFQVEIFASGSLYLSRDNLLSRH
jgi:hypothetical protein